MAKISLIDANPFDTSGLARIIDRRQ